MSRMDHLRLIAKVADMYYAREMKQAEISRHLGVHQSTVSRLLGQAQREGIVRISLNHPAGFHPDLETGLEHRFALSQAIVVDSASTESELASRLGSAAAAHLGMTLKPADVIGISSWSSALLAMVNTMHPPPTPSASRVVQILGGIGIPSVEVHATHLTSRLAQLLGAEAVFLTAPGIVRSAGARRALSAEPYVRKALDLFPALTTALVGIGTMAPSALLADSGNAFNAEELTAMRAAGAVGDICQRYYRIDGTPISHDCDDDQVIGISLEQLQQVPRVIGVAGGVRKLDAILGALHGRWLDVLITDHDVAAAIMNMEG